MRALLLAAGLGTRLSPPTNHLPKCLVPINDRPLLEYWLRRLADAGCGPVTVNTHHFAENVWRWIKNSEYGKGTRIVHEDELLGTGELYFETGILQENSL